MAEGLTKPGDHVPWAEIRIIARERFGITRFRPGQRELIEWVLAGGSALGVLPTGAGKSLCYQIPSLFLEGTVVVVSPLIALMQDQQERLQEAAIEAARLDSTVSARDQRQQEDELRAGLHDIVLITPERLQKSENVAPLKARRVALFVVDEAHCISQWGHDFRPAYLELRHVIEELGNPPVLALTATAPPELAQDILARLGIEDARIVQAGIERENLLLEVKRTVNEEEKQKALLTLLKEVDGAGILYVATIKAVEEIHQWLASREIAAERYHGQMSKRDREAAQSRFMDGDSRLIVATSAFGLGVDKADVRFVAHWHFPGSVESYYQEAGRAGRDGKPSRCVLFYRLEDKRIRSFFIGGKRPHQRDVEALLQVFADAGEDAALTAAELARLSGLNARRVAVLASGLEELEVLERERNKLRLARRLGSDELRHFVQAFEAQHAADRERLRSMMQYGDTAMCRMKFLREYFGEPPGDNCGHCDNCRRPSHVSMTLRMKRAVRRSPRRMQQEGAAREFQAGRRVRHARFGTGEVLRAENDQVVVAFIRHGERRILASKLKLE